MKELSEFSLSLKSLPLGVYEYEYSLEDSFFEAIDAPDVKQGALEVTLEVTKNVHNVELRFRIEGEIVTICDRCLDELLLPIETEQLLYIKFGKEYSEESDDLIIISEDEGTYNVAWIIYEYIVLSLPIVRRHEEGECNEDMMALYSKYVVGEVGEEDDDELDYDEVQEEKTEVDPRWAALKNILDNN